MNTVLADTQIFQLCKVCCRCYCGCRCQLLPCQSCTVPLCCITCMIYASYSKVPQSSHSQLQIAVQYGVLQNPRPQTIPSSEADCNYFDPAFSQLPHYCILSGICRKIATSRDMTTGMSPTVLRCRYRLLLHPLIYRACRNRHSPVCYG